MKSRIVKQIVRGHNAIDGAGVHLRRVLGYKTIEAFDPFLMLDGFDSYNPDDYIKGFPWHPHRGIETITYLIHGEIVHGDSLGNMGTIRDLDCQWMTAGSGIIHQEMPLRAPRLLGCQLWLNMPAKNKMADPAYGDIHHNRVPIIKEDNDVVRILSGTYKGNKGAFEGEYVKMKYLDVDLAPNCMWQNDETPNDETFFIYLLEGSLAVDTGFSQFEEKGCAILFESTDKLSDVNDRVEVRSGEKGARFLVLAAKPIHEPVAWGGPIVMNNTEELNEAFMELDNGTFIKHKTATV